MSPDSRCSSVSPTHAITPSSRLEAGACPASDHLVGLAEQLSPLGMADECGLHAELAKHLRRDLAGVGAARSQWTFWA